MKSLLLAAVALACGIGLAPAARAQPKQVIATCGSGVTFAVGDGVNGTINTAGQECTTASVTVPGSVTVSGAVTVTSGSVTTSPAGAASTQAAGTVTLGATFQTALAASSTRLGCTIQNTSTHTMYVFVGTLGSATTGNSYQVPPNGTFACNAGPIVLTGAVNLTTSTTADTFVVANQ